MTSISSGQTGKKASSTTSKNLFANNPYIQKGASLSLSSSSGGTEYSIGDSIEHVKFGIGTVTDTVNKGDYTEISIDFEDFGIRKVRSNFSGIKKI